MMITSNSAIASARLKVFEGGEPNGRQERKTKKQDNHNSGENPPTKAKKNFAHMPSSVDFVIEFDPSRSSLFFDSSPASPSGNLNTATVN